MLNQGSSSILSATPSKILLSISSLTNFSLCVKHIYQHLRKDSAERESVAHGNMDIVLRVVAGTSVMMILIMVLCDMGYWKATAGVIVASSAVIVLLYLLKLSVRPS